MLALCLSQALKQKPLSVRGEGVRGLAPSVYIEFIEVKSRGEANLAKILFTFSCITHILY
jgi:hypothetical protein